VTALAWHFVARDASGRPVLRDGRPVVVGEWLRHRGPLELCESGLHASSRALDALRYAPGPVVCRVALGWRCLVGNDKIVASARKVLWLADSEQELRAFARWCALQVADHLPPRTDPVVRRWLESGDESIRDAARSAAWSAARGAARSAAWSATEAVRSAAWSATWSAAEAAQSAAWSAAWSAADSARNAAERAADSAAERAADSAAERAAEAVRRAGWGAAWALQATEMERRLLALGCVR